MEWTSAAQWKRWTERWGPTPKWKRNWLKWNANGMKINEASCLSFLNELMGYAAAGKKTINEQWNQFIRLINQLFDWINWLNWVKLKIRKRMESIMKKSSWRMKIDLWVVDGMGHYGRSPIIAVRQRTKLNFVIERSEWIKWNEVSCANAKQKNSRILLVAAQQSKPTINQHNKAKTFAFCWWLIGCLFARPILPFKDWF